MTGERAEEILGWQPIPDVPRRFHRLLAEAGTYLDRCVANEDQSYEDWLVDTLDRVVRHKHFDSRY